MVEPRLQRDIRAPSSHSTREGPEVVSLHHLLFDLRCQLTRRSTWTNSTTGQIINYYEVDIKPFQQQVYSNLGKANLVGYDGISPGPTFRMEKGQEAVVRFINHGTLNSSVHLHGSYSKLLRQY